MYKTLVILRNLMLICLPVILILVILAFLVEGFAGMILLPFLATAFVLFVIFAISADFFAVRSGTEPPRSKTTRVAMAITGILAIAFISWIFYGMLGIWFPALRY